MLGDHRLEGMAFSIPASILDSLNNSNLALILKQAVSEEDDSCVLSVCRFLAQFGETFLTFILKNFSSTQVVKLLELALLCSSLDPSVFSQGVQAILYFWFLVQDAIENQGELGIGNRLDEGILRQANAIFKRLLEILYRQIQYPVDGELKQWSKGLLV